MLISFICSKFSRNLVTKSLFMSLGIRHSVLLSSPIPAVFSVIATRAKLNCERFAWIAALVLQTRAILNWWSCHARCQSWNITNALFTTPGIYQRSYVTHRLLELVTVWSYVSAIIAWFRYAVTYGLIQVIVGVASRNMYQSHVPIGKIQRSIYILAAYINCFAVFIERCF